LGEAIPPFAPRIDATGWRGETKFRNGRIGLFRSQDTSAP